MGSATRHAMAAATDALARVGDAGVETAQEVFRVAQVLAANRQLRAVLADASAPGEAKERLLVRVFGAAIAEPARQVLFTAVHQRWSRDDDLVSGIEELGIRLAAQAGDADRIQRELFSFGRAVASDPDLELALDSKVGLDDEKGALLDTLLAGRAAPATAAILQQVVSHARRGSIRAAIERAAEIVATQRGQVVAMVTVAAALTPQRKQNVAAHLAQQYGGDVTVNYMVDPDIVGGMRIRVGNEVIDGTITARLADLRLGLAG